MKFDDDDVVTEHPSYGMIGVSRIHGNPGPLFGSDIVHRDVIRITVHRAKHRRSLASDWYHPTEEIIEIDMSGAQYAEMISNPNVGFGVPCTIRTLFLERQPDPPFRRVRETMRAEFAYKAQRVGRLLAEFRARAADLAAAKAPTKAERQAVADLASAAAAEIASNMPFLAKCFDEHMEQSETEAKAAIEAFWLRLVTEAGLTALRGPGGAELERPAELPAPHAAEQEYEP